MHSNKSKHYDIVIVGSGISCTAFLLSFLEKLPHASHCTKAISIAVVEKKNEFWKGIPYGKRSSLNSLTITTLGEFIPPSEKDSFLRWIKENLDMWTAELKEKAGNTGEQWLKNNSPLIEAGRWDDIYLPRYLFGNYLNKKILKIIDTAKQNRLATVFKLEGEVIDLTKRGNTYELIAEDDLLKPFSITAGVVILAIGSPPVKSLQSTCKIQTCEYVNDIYNPCLESNLTNIESALAAVKQPFQRNILVIGSNASSLELLYMVETTPTLRAWLNTLAVLSYSGKLPYLIGPTNDMDYRFERVLSLNSLKPFTATELISAFEEDVDIAERKGVNIGNLCQLINTLVVDLVNAMDKTEQKYFYEHHGQRFAKLVRRAGGDYRNAADSLKRDSKLVLLKGSFCRLEPPCNKGTGARVIYTLNGNTEEITFPLEFSVVVNCGGSESLDNSSSRLIKGLVSKGLCVVNNTKKGVEVTEDLEAVKGLYVIGPLLGGIFNSRVRLWHVENAKSIFRLGHFLAEILVQRLSQKT